MSAPPHLSEQVLQQILGGLLLTYFRSGHPASADLYVFHDYALPTHDNATVRVDWAIVDGRARQAVGAYELVTTVPQWTRKRQKLQDLAQTTRLGVATPAAIASELRQEATASCIELVTYPASW